MENSHLIVGLGNPGAEYADTRHNAGFIAVGRLGECWAGSWVSRPRLKARVADCRSESGRVRLCLPQTFMNRSGESVAALVRYHRIPVSRLLVVVDDADLPLGTIRLRPGGSCGGHHGLESVENHLNTREFARLRIGIGRKAEDFRQIRDYVLERFRPNERKLADRAIDRAVEQMRCWVSSGVAAAMNRFNGSVTEPEKDE